jgi:HCOMODA/2-hydroxy-3-carboxy-muconic semialdehyde decarboxylase
MPTDDPDWAAKNDLALANHIFATLEAGILDAMGHVSMRNPNNPNSYFISRNMAPASVTVEDIIENDLDSQPLSGPRLDEYQEIFMHGEIYKARPDVMAIVHSHTPEFVAFGQSTVKLLPVSYDGLFLRDGLPVYTRPGTITSTELGEALVDVLGDAPAAMPTATLPERGNTGRNSFQVVDPLPPVKTPDAS